MNTLNDEDLDLLKEFDKKDVDAQYIKNNAQSETTKERDVWINNIENKYIYDLCSRCFDEFIDNFVTRYENVKKRDVGFVGSIAFYFQDIIKERLERRGFVLGKIVKEPIDGLIEFHCC